MSKIEKLYKIIKDKNQRQNKTVKKEIQGKKLLDYFFNERKSIVEWNRYLNIFEFSFFSLNINLNNNFNSKLSELFIDNILPFIRYLEKIIKEGWQYGVLTISEYNVIVYFYDFARKYAHIEKKKNIYYKDFFLVEEAFLKITSNDDNIDLLILGLDKILKFYFIMKNRNYDDISELLQKLEFFFTPGYYSPSFYDLIIGYNIKIYKRFIKWRDVIKISYENSVPDDFYNCPKDVLKNLLVYLNKLNENINLLKKEIKSIEWLKLDSEIDKNDPVLFKMFYKSLNNNWEKDSNDLILLIIITIEGILKNLNFILHKQWRVMDENEKINDIYLIKDESINMFFSKIQDEFDLVKSKQISMISVTIPLKNFVEADFPESLFYNNELKYIYGKLSVIFYHFFQISHEFRDYISDESKEKNSYLKYMIVAPDEWAGKPVFFVFEYFYKLFLQICRFFREKNLQLKIRDLAELEKKLKQKQEKFNNIIGNNDYIKDILEEEE